MRTQFSWAAMNRSETSVERKPLYYSQNHPALSPSSWIEFAHGVTLAHEDGYVARGAATRQPEAKYQVGSM